MAAKVKTAKLGMRHRAMTIGGDVVDADGRAEFSASSESPVLSYDWEIGRYYEVLDHSATAVRMSRLQDGAPLLKDHDRRTQIGRIESARVEGGQLRVAARFGNSDVAKAERADVADGIRSKVSIGYIVHELRLDSRSENGIDVYRATDWEPLEVSTVAIPADPTVGFGRAEGDVAYREHVTRVIGREIRQGEKSMDQVWVIRREDGVLCRISEAEFDASKHERAAGPAGDQRSAPAATPAPAQAPAATVDANAIEQRERKRVEEILAIGARWNCSDKAHEAIKAGVPWEVFRDHVWSRQAQDKPLETPKTHLGLGKREVEGFSIVRAMRAIADGRRQDAAFEFECSDEIAKNLGRQARGIFVPSDVQYAEGQISQRDVTKATSGGNLVATNLLSGSFIELLRNSMKVASMGARMLPGLVGDVAIPRQATGSVAAWVGEGGNTTESDATFDTVTLNPKTITVRTDMTRRMLLQSTPAIEGLVRADLAMALGLGIDSAAINGTGALNQPRGIRNVVGVGLVALGANGAAPTWQSQIDLVKTCKIANADQGTLGFLTNASAWGKMMGTPKVAGQPIFILEDPGSMLLGRRFETTEAVPSNLVKGASGAVCSAELYGNWAELLIGEWGVLDLFPDPYVLADSGGLAIRAFKDVDVAVRHAASFAIIVDMLTT